jgi:hypothetical protein
MKNTRTDNRALGPRGESSVSLRIIPTFAKAAIIAYGIISAGLQARHTLDNPERGIQGETLPGEDRVLDKPYSKGINLIGHSRIDGREGNLAMTWSGHCAYVADGLTMGRDGMLHQEPSIGPLSGVAVINVSNPAAPTVARYLKDKGTVNATETLHALTVKGRPILAISNYGGVAGMSAPKEGWLSLYDPTDCIKPRLLSEVQWPEPVHTIRISPDGQFVYGAILNPFTGDGGIAVMDIKDRAKPRFVGKFGATPADGSSYAFATHELVFSTDGKRIYAGVLSSKGGDLNPDFKPAKLGMPAAETVGQNAGGIYILDNSEILARKPDAKLRLISTAHKAGWHSPVRARINGKPYLVNAGELGACPSAWPRITSIADERKPRLVGEFKLAMNLPENCPPRTAIEAATGGMVGRSGAAGSHYQDVDDSENTRLGLFPFVFAGLRIADLRKPEKPVEIAYFKPGDLCGSRVRYVAETGHIWFACGSSGFYVIELKPELRKQFNLPKIKGMK